MDVSDRCSLVLAGTTKIKLLQSLVRRRKNGSSDGYLKELGCLLLEARRRSPVKIVYGKRISSQGFLALLTLFTV